MSQRRRIVIAVVVGVLAGLLIWRYHPARTMGGYLDFFVPLCGARSLLAGLDPYGPQCAFAGSDGALPYNPMTTVLAVLPFAPFKDYIANALILGVSSGLLAYGVLRTGPPWRLLIFASPLYWYAMLQGQWAILLTAIALLPSLLPLALVKPHIGLPVILTRLTRRRLIALCACGLLSLAVLPSWPLRWLASLGNYPGFVPLLVLPAGPLLLLGLLRWRVPNARLLLLMAVVPQKAYDPLCLLLLPATRKHLAVLCLLGWLPLLNLYFQWLPPALCLVCAVYLPALAMVLWPVSTPATVRSTTTARLGSSSPSRPN